MDGKGAFGCPWTHDQVSLVAQLVKTPPAMWKIWVRSLGWEDPLEEGMATLQYSCLENPMDRGAWRAAVHGVTAEQISTGPLATGSVGRERGAGLFEGFLPCLFLWLEELTANLRVL